MSEERIAAGVRGLCSRFERVTFLIEHLRIVDEPEVRRQIEWLRRNRRDLWDELRPVIKASWDRGYPQAAEQRAHAKKVAIEIEARRTERFAASTRQRMTA
jgi:hypothetical protein